MKNKTLVFFTLTLLIITTQAAAISVPPGSTAHEPSLELLKTHNTINSAALRISLDDNLHGFVDSKVCSFCKTIRIIITPDTIAYRNNVRVSLEQAKDRNGRFATVVYNLKTKNISAIRW